MNSATGVNSFSAFSEAHSPQTKCAMKCSVFLNTGSSALRPGVLNGGGSLACQVEMLFFLYHRAVSGYTTKSAVQPVIQQIQNLFHVL